MATYNLTNGYMIEVSLEENPRDPRENDNLTKMVCFHRRYTLGDKHDYKKEDYNSWDKLKKAIIKKEKPAAIAPLYLYNHSGVSIATTPFSCTWDSGQVGFIFVSRETLFKEFLGKKLTDELRKKAQELISAEAEEYNSYIQGDVKQYTVQDQDGEVVDSCSGFIGMTDEEIIEYAGYEIQK